MASWSEMSSGSRTTAVAVLALLLGGGGYGLWRANQPEPAPLVSEAAPGEAAPGEVAVSAAEPAATAAATAEADPATAPAADPAADPETAVEAAPEAAAEATVAAAPESATEPAPEIAAEAAEVAALPEAAAAPAEPLAEAPAPLAAPTIDLARIEPDGAALIAGQAAPGAVVSLMTEGAEVATATADANGKFVAMFTMPADDTGRLLSFKATMPDGSEVAGVGQIAVAAVAAPVVVAEAAAPAASETTAATPEATPEAIAATPEATPKASTEVTAATEAASEAPPEPATGTTALAVTDEGVKVLQSGTEVPADVAANVSLDVIAYPSQTEVQFGGRGLAGQFVRLYLDNAPVGEAVAIGADGGWSVVMAGIAPGIFALRVDQVDGSGKVTSRFETPFKRETPEALAAAAGVAPVVEATAVEAAPEAEAADPVAPDAVAEVAPEPAPAESPQVATGAEAPAEPVAVAETPSAPEAPAEVAVAEVAPAPVTVTVQPGYTLWGIAKENFGEGVLYVQVFEANRDKIRNPDLIYPGQVFAIPAGN